MGRKRKEKPEIFYVQTSPDRGYFAYDYYESGLGKPKRLYADTKEKLEEKIQHVKEEEERKLLAFLPKTTLLKDWAMYYFKSIVNKVSASELKSIISLFETSVFGSEIDRDITAITAEEMKNFYLILKNRYEIKNVIKTDSVLRNIFKTANEKGIKTFDYDEIPVPEKKTDERFHEVPSGYMPTAKEQQIILDYCLSHSSLGSLSWTIIFASFTGIKLTAVAKLLHKDFHFSEKFVDTGNGIVPLSNECMNWLKRIIAEKAVLIAGKETDWEEHRRNISGYTSFHSFDNLTAEQVLVLMNENQELMNDFTENYLKQNPENVMFVTRKNTPVAIPNSQRVLKTIAGKCNLPKGITGISLHKAFIAKELENGKSMTLLKNRYGYKRESDIAEIKAEYELQKLLTE